LYLYQYQKKEIALNSTTRRTQIQKAPYSSFFWCAPNFDIRGNSQIIAGGGGAFAG